MVGSTKVLTSTPAKRGRYTSTGAEGSRLVGRQLVEKQLAVPEQAEKRRRAQVVENAGSAEQSPRAKKAKIRTARNELYG